MKITKCVILAIAVLLTDSFALAMENGITPKPIIFPVVLAPAAVAPLASLDLIPPSVKTDSYYPNLNLNPQIASTQNGQKPLIRNVQVTATGDTLFTINLGAMVALNATDYFTTRGALDDAALQEANPLMKLFVKSPIAFAAIKIGLTAVSYFALKALYKKNKPLAWIISIASNLALSYVVFNNLRLLSRVQ
jgi:Domain of unknown function (DUF5658)